MIIRYNAPTHLDVMEYLTEWHHELEDGTMQIWIQTSKLHGDNNKPQWIRLGDLLEKIWLKDERPGLVGYENWYTMESLAADLQIYEDLK